MKTSHQVIWNNATLQAATAPLNQQVFGNNVCAVRIQNRSVWVLMVTETATGAPVEELPPMSWCLIPNPVDFTFNLLAESNNLPKPSDMKVSVTYVDSPVSYAFGTLNPLNGQSIPSQLVTNDISNPVNTLSVTGSPVSSSYTSLTTSWSTLLVLNSVVQKIFVSTGNSSATASTASNQTLFLANSVNGGNGSYNPEWSFIMGAIAAMTNDFVTAGPYYTIDCSPGIFFESIMAFTNTTSDGVPSVLVDVIS